jgi:hypothetical protein
MGLLPTFQELLKSFPYHDESSNPVINGWLSPVMTLTRGGTLPLSHSFIRTLLGTSVYVDCRILLTGFRKADRHPKSLPLI